MGFSLIVHQALQSAEFMLEGTQRVLQHERAAVEMDRRMVQAYEQTVVEARSIVNNAAAVLIVESHKSTLRDPISAEGTESQIVQRYTSDKVGHELLDAFRTTSMDSPQGQPQ